MSRKILIVDDEEIIVETIACNLGRAGYLVLTATDAVSALEAAQRECPDLIVLDLTLSGLDGLDVCRQLRRKDETAMIPILMLTVGAEEIDKVVCLEIGADDCMTKPFGYRELLARIHALLRRSAYPSVNLVENNQGKSAKHEHGGQARVFAGDRKLIAGPLCIDLVGRRVNCRGVDIELQLKLFDLLTYLVRNRGTALTRSQLLHHIWGYDYLGDTRTVDVHIRWLREKLEEEPANPKLIQTVRSVGYIFR